MIEKTSQLENTRDKELMSDSRQTLVECTNACNSLIMQACRGLLPLGCRRS